MEFVTDLLKEAESWVGVGLMRGEDAGHRQAGPESQPEGRCQDRVGVCTDGVERDVAKVEQPGQPDDDVQAPPEHDVGQHEGAKVDVVAGAGEGQGDCRYKK